MNLRNLPAFYVSDYSIWPPSVGTEHSRDGHNGALEEAFSHGDLPPVGFLPIAQRKKLSPLTKVSCFLLNELLSKLLLDPTQVRIVFSSRFGEADNTIQLLRSIRDDEPTSPMAFSRSVHNSSIGIFSIATSNRTLSSTVAGGNRSVSAGLTEAIIQLYSSPDIEHVLYVHADEKMPKEYFPLISKPKVPFGFACLLKKAESSLDLCFKEGEDEAMWFIRYLLEIVS